MPSALAESLEIRPQPGPQAEFLACQSDIAFIGGSVFGGKTWALVAQPFRHIENPAFTCVTFRRTAPDIRNPGSLWDQSMQLYPTVNAEPRPHMLEWEFPSGARVKFAGLQYETDVLSWKSSQIALVQFDQVEEFTEHQFWYMQSRNRSTCGIRPYTRGSCNALADTWVADFISWWWDQDTGYAIKERSGLARWFIRVNDVVQWSDVTCYADDDPTVFGSAAARAKAELERRFPGAGRFARSFAFIRAALADNAIGVAADPEYEARVRSMSLVEQERLLGGNWKIRPAAGLVFNRAWFEIVDAAPAKARRVRFWDKASTVGGSDNTAGCKMSEAGGAYYIEDMQVGQWASGERENLIKQIAEADKVETSVGVEQEPGSAGKDVALMTVRNLAGYKVRAIPSTGNKAERASPLAAQAQVGNVKLVRGPWNEALLRELHAFPTTGIPDDQVDAASGAFKMLTTSRPLDLSGFKPAHAHA